MKFRERNHIPRHREEVAQDHEPKSGSPFFDPRVDLPKGALSRLTQKGVGDARRGIDGKEMMATLWIRWVDPEYRGRLRAAIGQPDVDYSIQDDLVRQIKQGQRTPHMNVANLIGEFSQVYPEARASLDQLLNQDFFELVIADIQKDRKLNPVLLRNILLVWPKQRQEILTALGLGSVTWERLETLLDNTDNSLMLLTDAGHLALVFPEFKQQILERVNPVKKEWKRLFRSLRIYQFDSGFAVLQELLSSLTILGAQAARIDEQGQMQVQLYPLEGEGAISSIPARSTL